MEIRLSSPDIDFHVDVRLTRSGSRWLAAADIAGEREFGVGRNAREALAASLWPLGPEIASTLLADPSLFGPSRQVL